jgi:hypothetical protein
MNVEESILFWWWNVIERKYGATEISGFVTK